MTPISKQEITLTLQQLSNVVMEFIRKAPSFTGDCDIAAKIGENMGKLEGQVEKLPETS